MLNTFGSHSLSPISPHRTRDCETTKTKIPRKLTVPSTPGETVQQAGSMPLSASSTSTQLGLRRRCHSRKGRDTFLPVQVYCWNHCHISHGDTLLRGYISLYIPLFNLFSESFLICEAVNKTNKTNQAKEPNRPTQEQVPSWVKGKNGKSWVPCFETRKMSSACPSPEGPGTPWALAPCSPPLRSLEKCLFSQTLEDAPHHMPSTRPLTAGQGRQTQRRSSVVFSKAHWMIAPWGRQT